MSSIAVISLNGPQLTAFYRAARRDAKLAVLEGFHAVKHAMRFGAAFECIHGVEAGAWRQLVQTHAPDIADVLATQIRELPAAQYTELAPNPPGTGLIAVARRPHRDLDQLWRSPGRAPLVLLDRPAHAGNVGAVIRTAAAAGADAVLTMDGPDPWHPNVIRGAAALQFAIPVGALDAIPATSRPVVAFDADGDRLNPEHLADAPIIALGAERHGLSAALRARADRTVALPMRKGISSLNLAATAAIALYCWRLTQS